MTPLALGPPLTTNRHEFADWLEDAAAACYLTDHPGGQVREFDFKGSSYLFDDRQGIDRTILAMSPPTADGVARDAYAQRIYPLSDPAASGRSLDRGHFIPHSAGGHFGPNLFPQDRALNRRWSPDGRAYSAMERAAIAAGAYALLLIRRDSTRGEPLGDRDVADSVGERPHRGLHPWPSARVQRGERFLRCGRPAAHPAARANANLRAVHRPKSVPILVACADVQ